MKWNELKKKCVTRTPRFWSKCNWFHRLSYQWREEYDRSIDSQKYTHYCTECKYIWVGDKYYIFFGLIQFIGLLMWMSLLPVLIPIAIIRWICEDKNESQ
jgi:hypothetical protein